MAQKKWVLSAVASAALLAACGGGGGGDDNSRGNLLEAPQTIATVTAAQLDAGTASSGLQPLTGKARCDVKVQQLNYRTTGPNGESTNASAALLTPAGACAGGSFPLIAYANGTDVQKPRTLANPTDSETSLLAAMYAAQGYAVVATDYLGFAKSAFPYHPYLHADSEASSMVDAIRAARFAEAQAAVGLNGKVMVTGYSQGGHSSAATQRAIERDNAGEINLVAAAHLAPPLNLSGSFKIPTAIAGYQFFVPYIVTSWQKVYGNVYTSPGQAFKAPYDGYIENLLPSPTLTYTTLVTSGQLPGDAPDVAKGKIFQDAFINAAATDNSNPLYQDAQKNDLLAFNPKARTLLCGGAGDPTVPPAVHMNVALAGWQARGLGNVGSVDVDPQVQATFGPGGKAPTDPASAAFATYYGSYHGTYEPPFCHAAARALFDQFK